MDAKQNKGGQIMTAKEWLKKEGIPITYINLNNIRNRSIDLNLLMDKFAKDHAKQMCDEQKIIDAKILRNGSWQTLSELYVNVENSSYPKELQ